MATVQNRVFHTKNQRGSLKSRTKIDFCLMYQISYRSTSIVIIPQAQTTNGKRKQLTQKGLVCKGLTRLDLASSKLEFPGWSRRFGLPLRNRRSGPLSSSTRFVAGSKWLIASGARRKTRGSGERKLTVIKQLSLHKIKWVIISMT